MNILNTEYGIKCKNCACYIWGAYLRNRKWIGGVTMVVQTPLLLRLEDYLLLSLYSTYLWQERNRRILQHVATSTGQLLTAITKVVQIVVVSWPKAPRIQEN
mgnify:FL=1